MNPLERLWHDTMTVKRWTDVITDGVTSSELTVIYIDVKCHYSKGTLTTTGTDDAPTLINKYTLFCSIDSDVQEGDVVIVTQRNGKTVELTVGEGFPYTTHQEFTVKRNEKA
jgi:hypothetical protein